MTPTMNISQDEATPRPAVGPPAGWARFLVGFVVLWAVLAVASSGDPTARWGPAILAVVVAASLGVSRVLYRLPWRAAVRALGLGRPDRRALAVSAGISALVLLVWPATALLSGASIPLRSDWPVVLIGILALHGLAEEMIWRGYVFRRLARGRSFWPAVCWTMPLIAITHVPIIVTSGPAIGVGAMLVAATTSIALSRLYTMGGGTLWAPAVLHAAIDSFKLVVLPAAAVPIYPFLIIGFSIVVPLLVLMVPTAPRRRHRVWLVRRFTISGPADRSGMPGPSRGPGQSTPAGRVVSAGCGGQAGRFPRRRR
jgi:membrane protease YdiL (CAAX protease family)